MKFENLTALYQYFDELAEQGADSDILFASSYIRGFISLAASEYGSEEQNLTQVLADDITVRIDEARRELSPKDTLIVKNYWEWLKEAFAA